MCRPGGRRCPGQYDPAKQAAVNAKRRAQRAAKKAAGARGGSATAQGAAPAPQASPPVSENTPAKNALTPPESIPQDPETKRMLLKLDRERELLASKNESHSTLDHLMATVRVHEADEALRARGIEIMRDEERLELERTARELSLATHFDADLARENREEALDDLDDAEYRPETAKYSANEAMRRWQRAEDKYKNAQAAKERADAAMEKNWGKDSVGVPFSRLDDEVESDNGSDQSSVQEGESSEPNVVAPSITPEQEKKFPAMKTTLERMGRTATSMRAQGKVEEAKALELTMVELAGAKSYTRLDVIYAVKEDLAKRAYVAGNDSLGDTYMVARDYSLAANNNTFREKNLKVVEENNTDAENPYKWSKVGALREEQDRQNGKKKHELPERVLRASDGSEYSPREIVNGVRDSGEEIPKSHRDELYPSITQEMGENSRALVNAVAPGGKPPRYEIDEETMEPLADSPKPGTPVPGAPQFTYLGNGNEQNVYLHGETGLVYKVPHEKNLWMMAKRSSYVDMQRVSEEAYAEIDNDALRANGVEHIPTMFTSARSGDTEFSVVVQPKIPRGEWEEFDLSDEAIKELKGMGVDDLHAGNVMVNPVTGKVMLLDCLKLDRTSV